MRKETQYFAGEIGIIKQQLRDKYMKLGYIKISMNIFIKNSNVIIIRSMVQRTNPNEWKYLSLNSKQYKKIKNKSITIIMLQRINNMDIFHNQYNINVNSLVKTTSYRDKNRHRYRYIINEYTKEKNITREIYEGFGRASETVGIYKIPYHLNYEVAS